VDAVNEGHRPSWKKGLRKLLEIVRRSIRHFRTRRRRSLLSLEAHERANERFFDEAETLLLFARRLSEIFANGDSDRKKTLLKVVASNATLSDGKAHLNLKPAFATLAKRGDSYSWLRG